MKCTKFENKILDFLEKNWNLFVLFFIIVAGLVLRLKFINFESDYYKNVVFASVIDIKNNGGFHALSHQISDFTVFNTLLLIVLVKAKLNIVVTIKVFYILCDFITAVITYLLINNLKKNKFISIAAFGIAFLNPVLFFNSYVSMYEDAVFVMLFTLFLYFLHEKKYIVTFIISGIIASFSFYGIIVLVLLIYIYIYKINDEKNFSICLFLIPLGMLCLSVFPAVLMGRKLADIINVYGNVFYPSRYAVTDYPSIIGLMVEKYDDAQFFGTIKSFPLGLTVLFVTLLVMYSWIRKNKDMLYMLWLISYTCIICMSSINARWGILPMILGIIILLVYDYDSKNYLRPIIVAASLALYAVIYSDAFIGIDMIYFPMLSFLNFQCWFWAVVEKMYNK